MKIDLRITLTLSEQEWADEYGLERKEVRADVREAVKNALFSLPVTPSAVVVREQRSS